LKVSQISEAFVQENGPQVDHDISQDIYIHRDRRFGTFSIYLHHIPARFYHFISKLLSKDLRKMNKNGPSTEIRDTKIGDDRISGLGFIIDFSWSSTTLTLSV